MAGFSPPDYVSPLPEPPVPATEVNGIPVDWDPPPANPPALTATITRNGQAPALMSATHDNPLPVPDGGDGVVTRMDTDWPVTLPGGSTLWRIQILTPGAEDDTWTLTVAGVGYDYVVLLGDDASDVANGLQAAAAAGAAADGYAVTDNGATLSILWAFPATPYETPSVSTDGSGTSENVTSQVAGTPTGFNPPATPPALTAEVDGVPMSSTHDNPLAVPDGGDWVITES